MTTFDDIDYESIRNRELDGFLDEKDERAERERDWKADRDMEERKMYDDND